MKRITSRENGFTLLEMTIAAAFFTVMIIAILVTLDRAARLYVHGETQADLQIQATKAMARMVSELRNAGYVPITPGNPGPYVNGQAYPYIFADGRAYEGGAYWMAHTHTPANHTAQPGDPAYGETREIVFRSPWNTNGSWADFDLNGFPINGSTGQIEWSNEEVSYVLVTDPIGVNVLERRVNGANPVAIARYVERVTFDTQLTDPTVNVNQIVISLYLAKTTERGERLRASIVSSVNMRNAGEVK